MYRRRRPLRAWLWAAAVIVGLFIAARALIFALYPFPYRTSVETWARANQLDPQLVAALIRVESRWQPRAISRKGAMGLMQIMPETASFIATTAKLPPVPPGGLNDPDLNIRLGTWYLAYLIQECDGNVPMALAAYNGGIQNVREWVQTKRWDGRAETAVQIPFPETRRYVGRVLTDFQRYQWIYGREP